MYAQGPGQFSFILSIFSPSAFKDPGTIPLNSTNQLQYNTNSAFLDFFPSLSTGSESGFDRNVPLRTNIRQSHLQCEVRDLAATVHKYAHRVHPCVFLGGPRVTSSTPKATRTISEYLNHFVFLTLFVIDTIGSPLSPMEVMDTGVYTVVPFLPLGVVPFQDPNYSLISASRSFGPLCYNNPASFGFRVRGRWLWLHL